MQVETNIAIQTRVTGRSVSLEHERAEPKQALVLGAARIERWAGGKSWSANDSSDCRLVFQTSLRSPISQRAKNIALESPAGSWIVQNLHPLEVEGEPGHDLLSISFPAALLSRSLAAHLQSAPAVSMPISGASQMCIELGRSCLSQVEAVSPAVADTLGDTLIELAKLAIIEQSGAKRGETMRETARARIQGFIHRNLADPDLTIDRIAERMQCTKRYLHKVFSEEGETLNHYIWTRRLELCRAYLARSDMSDKSITEIAFSCGFSNAAHFSRSFRARFGEAPRAYRRAALDS